MGGAPIIRPETGMAARRMSGEMAAAVGERRLLAEEDEEGEFTPFVVKQTEMQKLMTRLRNQAAKKQQLEQSASTATTATNDRDSRSRAPAGGGGGGGVAPDLSDGSSGLKAPNHLEIRNSDRHVASTDGKTNIGVGTGEGSDGDAGAAGLEQAREAASVDVAGVER